MQIVLDRSDFRRLSSTAQRELLEVLTGKPPAAQARKQETKGLRWRTPYDLSDDLAQRLVAKLEPRHIELLRLFARKDGRVRMKEVQQLNSATDLKDMTALQQEITRRLRHLIDDPEKKATLIHWDFDATKWDKHKTTIVDGVYFVSEATAKALAKAFGKSRRKVT